MNKQEIEVIVRGVWIDGGRLLICRDVEHGHCFLPGGHVEFGEPAAEALQREMAEELGLSLQVGRFLGAVESAFGQADGNGSMARRQEVNLVFELNGEGVDPAGVVSQESHIGFEWCQVEGLMGDRPRIDLLPPGMSEVVNSEAKGCGVNWASNWE